MSLLFLTDANFEEKVLKSEQPVLVDFYADWCGPCRLQGPIIEEVASAVGDKIKIFKMDIDANPQTAQKFQIMSIPTLIIFQKGEIAEKLTGLQSKDFLLEKLNSIK